MRCVLRRCFECIGSEGSILTGPALSVSVDKVLMLSEDLRKYLLVCHRQLLHLLLMSLLLASQLLS